MLGWVSEKPVSVLNAVSLRLWQARGREALPHVVLGLSSLSERDVLPAGFGYRLSQAQTGCIICVVRGLHRVIEGPAP